MNRKLTLLLMSMVFVVAFSALGFAYNEAPMLQEKVAAGILPPVDQRLPENPLVIEPLDGVGQYGGTWHRFSDSRDWSYIRMAMYGGSPVRWVDDAQGIAPNWVEAWESNADRTQWTLHLRKGIKWSDGDPMDADDFMFWWNDMVLHQGMSDPVPSMFIAGGTTAKITAPDSYTIKIDFAAPSPLLAESLAIWVNTGMGDRMIVPSHYLKQFHPDYSNSKDFEIFEEKMEWWFNPECPVITEWMPVRYETAQKLVLERNPYYYAVDTVGNQLPYIDRIEVDFVENLEVVKLRLLNGESEMQIRPYLDLTDLSMLTKGAKEYDYQVKFWDSGSGTGPLFMFNMNNPDPAKRELYKKPEFRRALSLAINRVQLQKMLYFNMGELTTGTMSPKAAEFHRTEEGQQLYKEWRDSYVAYEPERAKEMLDSIGVVDQDGDGWRDMPDGSKLSLRVDFNAAVGVTDRQTNEMVKSTWEAIGVRTVLNPVDGSQLTLMETTATYDIRNSWEIGGVPNFILFPQFLVPVDGSRWAPLNGAWYSVQGTAKEGTELDKKARDRTPPREKPEAGGVVERLQALYDQARVEPDEAERDRLALEFVRIHKEEGPFFIGTVGNYPRIVVVSNKMHNVPDREDLALGGWVNPYIVPYPAITNPAQYWLAQ